MSAVNFILSLARKILARESKGITTIPNQMAVEQKAGEIAARLQNAGLPLNRADEFIKSEQDLTRVLNMIESTPPVMKEVPSGIRSTKPAKVFDLKGREIKNTDNIMGGEELPPPGSRGGPDDIAAPIQSSEETIKNMIEAENKKNISKMRNRKMVDDAIDNVSPGFVKGDRKYNAQLVAEDLAEKKFGKEFYDLDQRQQMDLYDEALDGLSVDLDKFATGGRIGFSKGSGLKTIFNFLNENNPVQAYKKYLQSVKTRAQENPKELLPELAAITSGGIFVNRRMQDILKNMKEKDMENNLENFREELNKDPFYQKYPDIKDKVLENYTEKMFGEKRADGGRIGYKIGSIDKARRAFLKTAASIGGGIAALKTGLLNIGKGTTKQVAKEIITTPNAPGKPEWFDALVNKVIIEGTDVTKGFATKERQLVHTKQINDFAEVTVYRDLDTNTTTVNYGAKLRKDPTKPYERGNISRAVNDPDQIDLVVKGAEDIEPTIIENEKGFVRRRGTKSSAEFEAYESEPRVVNYDGDMEFDGTNVVNNVDDLNEDVSILKEYATGKKLTPKEVAKAKKKREDYQKFLEDPVEQANYLENKYGPGPEPDDFASGGIARMLGE